MLAGWAYPLLTFPGAMFVYRAIENDLRARLYWDLASAYADAPAPMEFVFNEAMATLQDCEAMAILYWQMAADCCL